MLPYQLPEENIPNFITAEKNNSHLNENCFMCLNQLGVTDVQKLLPRRVHQIQHTVPIQLHGWHNATLQSHFQPSHSDIFLQFPQCQAYFDLKKYITIIKKTSSNLSGQSARKRSLHLIARRWLTAPQASCVPRSATSATWHALCLATRDDTSHTKATAQIRGQFVQY